MQIKRILYYTVLCLTGLVALYFGICTVATFVRTLSQAVLISDTNTYYFLGYYIMSLMYFVAFSVVVAVIILLLSVQMRKSKL